MEGCSYNGTCHSCTISGLEYVETDEDLTCCVVSSSIVPGWIKKIIVNPSNCPEYTSRSFAVPVLVGLSVLSVGIFTWWALQRFLKRRSTPRRSSPRSVFARYEHYESMLPAPINWEHMEMDAAIASMEATTAL